MASISHKQPSRKGKKAWRRNIDITNVENELDEIRKEEIHGGRIDSKTNDQLFIIDKKGDEKVRKNVKSRKPLKMDEILSARSAIPPLPTRGKNSNLSNGIIKSSSQNEKRKLKKILRRKSTFSNLSYQTKNIDIDIVRNIWDNSNSLNNSDNDDIELPNSLKKPSKIPSTMKLKPEISVNHVHIPHAGQSYNPILNDHLDLLRKAHEIEVQNQIEKDEMYQIQSTWKKRKLGESIAEQEAIKKILLDHNKDDHDSNITSENDQDEIKSIPLLPSSNPKQKTKKQKLKHKKYLQEQEEIKKLKKEKIFKSQLSNLNLISKEIKSKEISSILPKSKKVSSKLGKHSIPKSSMDIQLSNELVESFRKLKPEGNLFRDRYISLTERHIIEPRIPVQKRQKFKTQFYEKHSYKKFS